MAFSEVKFSGLAEHHIELLLKQFGGIPEMPAELTGIDRFDEVQMIGVRDRLANIKLDLSSCWAMVRTVRGESCPEECLKHRELEDVEIALRVLHKLIRLGAVSSEDLAWAFHVSELFGEVLSGLDEDNVKRWQLNKSRDRQMESGDLRYGDETVAVDIDDPVDIGGTMGTEGDFGQVQIIEPNDKSHPMFFDLWVEGRTNQHTGQVYLDPQRETRSAVLSCVRELMDRPFVVRNNQKLVWKFQGFGGQLTAAATKTKNPRAPWKVAIPMEMMYRKLADKSEAINQLLGLVKEVLVGTRTITSSINWKSRQAMIRMWHVLKGNEQMPRFLIVNIWIHRDADWRVALGLPSDAAPAVRKSGNQCPPAVRGSGNQSKPAAACKCPPPAIVGAIRKLPIAAG
jgi:hypothetical protein